MPHGLFPDYEEVYDTDAGIWVVRNNSGDTLATLNVWIDGKLDWDYAYELIARDERIDIFDANTFPERFSAIANNWLEASEADWQFYQQFVEAARANFLEREGITDEVAAINGINPNLRSLWGIGYWIQHNRGVAISEQRACLVTPQELRIILEQEPTFVKWRTGIIKNDEGVTISQDHGVNGGSIESLMSTGAPPTVQY